MKKIFTLSVFILLTINTFAQLTPEITSWKINSSGATGYNNLPSNVQQVQYSASNVYVSATCIPGYDIGPWAGNPNIPANQNFIFKITRSPQQNTGTLINTPLGHIGVWSNGVSIYNAKDAMSYNSMGIWNQNAITVEGPSFDDCLGHPAPNGEYHHHLNPTCLYSDSDSTAHAPIIGFAFDGFPIYGAFGFANADGTGGVHRMKSSYRLRSITDRTTLPDGTVLTSGQYGPAINAAKPLGYYLEDFEFITGLGDLDVHNGRFSVTPDYPSGIYCYFATLDASLVAAFPYTLGLTYYGLVQAGNTGPGSGHNTPAETVTTYNPTSGIVEINSEVKTMIFPNPVQDKAMINISFSGSEKILAGIYDCLGQKLFSLTDLSSENFFEVDFRNFPAGVYFLRTESEGNYSMNKIVVLR